jgi:hypothetical protein
VALHVTQLTDPLVFLTAKAQYDLRRGKG